MGKPKQLLPWGDSTIIRTVVDYLTEAGAAPVMVVVGHRADEVMLALEQSNATFAYNQAYATSGLLQSFQAGLRALRSTVPVRRCFALSWRSTACGRVTAAPHLELCYAVYP